MRGVLGEQATADQVWLQLVSFFGGRLSETH